jgi:hypothetical protein
MMPQVSNDGACGTTPHENIAPLLGLKAATPQKAAGRFKEAPVCVPIASGHHAGSDSRRAAAR